MRCCCVCSVFLLLPRTYIRFLAIWYLSIRSVLPCWLYGGWGHVHKIEHSRKDHAALDGEQDMRKASQGLMLLKASWLSTNGEPQLATSWFLDILRWRPSYQLTFETYWSQALNISNMQWSIVSNIRTVNLRKWVEVSLVSCEVARDYFRHL